MNMAYLKRFLLISKQNLLPWTFVSSVLTFCFHFFLAVPGSSPPRNPPPPLPSSLPPSNRNSGPPRLPPRPIPPVSPRGQYPPPLSPPAAAAAEGRPSPGNIFKLNALEQIYK